MGKLRNHKSRNPIKIKYISSPMMVKASNAAEFRAIVQELTGQNSDVGKPSNVPTTFPEEANQVYFPFQVDSTAKIDDKDLLHTFPDYISPEFAEGYLWRGIPESFFGF